jgi:hypothetical protein
MRKKKLLPNLLHNCEERNHKNNDLYRGQGYRDQILKCKKETNKHSSTQGQLVELWLPGQIHRGCEMKSVIGTFKLFIPKIFNVVSSICNCNIHLK